jgi:sulfur-carrier protein
MQLEIHLYATLRKYSPAGAADGVFFLTLPDGCSVGSLMSSIGLSAEKVHLRMVNGVGVTDDHILRENDRVGLFPPVGGG